MGGTMYQADCLHGSAGGRDSILLGPGGAANAIHSRAELSFGAPCRSSGDTHAGCSSAIKLEERSNGCHSSTIFPNRFCKHG